MDKTTKVRDGARNTKRTTPKTVLLFALLALLIVALILRFAFAPDKKNETNQHVFKQNQWIHGITVDDSWYDSIDIEQVVEAIRAMPVKPTVRVVMSDDRTPAEYRELFSKLREVAFIMALPVDSFYMNAYKDPASYLGRFQAAYRVLSDYVDLWEIGNEINGVEWIQQSPKRIVDKVIAANDWIRAQGGLTAVTLYYTRSTLDQTNTNAIIADPKATHSMEMFPWIARHIPETLSENVDYVFVSYYEDDNGGYQPDWGEVFTELERVFPGVALGIGECGNTAAAATPAGKVKMAHAYYSMQRPSEHFVGGFFWWNWVQDCVPHQNNPIYEEINRCIEERK